MPSHLNEKKHAKQKRDALASGLVSESVVEGNDHADRLADEGVAKHASTGDLYAEANDRMDLTIITQKMMLHIWNAFVDQSDEHVGEADQQDSSILAETYEALTSQADEFYDYDSFAEEHADDYVIQGPVPHTAAATPAPAAAVATTTTANDTPTTNCDQGEDDAHLTIEQRYPDYGWSHLTPAKDENLVITRLIATNHRQFGDVVVPVAEGLDYEANGKMQRRKYKKFFIPHLWWEPVAWWFNQTFWSPLGFVDYNTKGEKHHRWVTWIELLLVFQAQTGYTFDPALLDIASQEKAFRAMFKKILKIAQPKCTMNTAKGEDLWRFGMAMQSVTPLVGHDRGGGGAEGRLLIKIYGNG